MKLLSAILFLFISCTPEEASHTEWLEENRSERAEQQRGLEGAAEERRIKRAEQQRIAEREAEESRSEGTEQQRIAEREAEERRIEREEQQRIAEREAEQRRIEREESAETPVEKEAIYIISFLNVGLAPNSVELTVNGETLSLDSDSFPVCVALKQSELNALSIDVYTPLFTFLGNHLKVSILEECSCSNNRDAEIKPCTTESDNYTFTVSGGHFLAIINWECTFEVQTTDIPKASDCRKF